MHIVSFISDRGLSAICEHRLIRWFSYDFYVLMNHTYESSVTQSCLYMIRFGPLYALPCQRCWLPRDIQELVLLFSSYINPIIQKRFQFNCMRGISMCFDNLEWSFPSESSTLIWEGILETKSNRVQTRLSYGWFISMIHKNIEIIAEPSDQTMPTNRR